MKINLSIELFFKLYDSIIIVVSILGLNEK